MANEIDSLKNAINAQNNRVAKIENDRPIITNRLAQAEAVVQELKVNTINEISGIKIQIGGSSTGTTFGQKEDKLKPIPEYRVIGPSDAGQRQIDIPRLGCEVERCDGAVIQGHRILGDHEVPRRHVHHDHWKHSR